MTADLSHNMFRRRPEVNGLLECCLVALRSGSIVADEVHPRRDYCWLKTYTNTPPDDMKYGRLCNFCWSLTGLIPRKFKKTSFSSFSDTGSLSLRGVNLKEQLLLLWVYVVLRTWCCIQNEDGVEITFGTENYLFSLVCMKNSFVWAMSRFAVVNLKVPIVPMAAVASSRFCHVCLWQTTF